MRLVLNAIFVTLVVLLMVFAMAPAGAIFPISSGNAYPQTVWSDLGRRGNVTGHVTGNYSTFDGIGEEGIFVKAAYSV